MAKTARLAPRDTLLARYERSPFVRAVVQVAPGFGGPTDTFLTEAYRKIQMDRLLAFIDEWERGGLTPTEEEIAQEPQLHATIGTLRAVANTQRREKIRLFARLLASYYKGAVFETTDAYDEALAILDDLGYREFQVLTILWRFERSAPPVSIETDEDRERVQQDPGWPRRRQRLDFWDDFTAAVEREVGIQRDHMPGLLARLNRTGLYRTDTSTYLGSDGVPGGLTPNFQTFVAALELREQR